VLVRVSVVVLVTVTVTVGGAIVEVEEELELLVVEEPEDQSSVPADNELREVPMSISPFCKPEFWRMPCMPQEAPYDLALCTETHTPEFITCIELKVTVGKEKTLTACSSEKASTG